MVGCWLYILRCSDGSYDVGTTRRADVESRVGEHNAGIHRGYTFRRRPVSLVYSAHFANITDAVASERRIKGWSRAKKKALIRSDFEALPKLSRRGLPHLLKSPSSFETPPAAAPQDEGL